MFLHLSWNLTSGFSIDAILQLLPISTSPTQWFASRPTQDLKLKVAFIGPFLLRHAVAGGDVDAVRNLIKWQKSVVAEMTVRVSMSGLFLNGKSQIFWFFCFSHFFKKFSVK